jgi:hypothetical protein
MFNKKVKIDLIDRNKTGIKGIKIFRYTILFQTNPDEIIFYNNKHEKVIFKISYTW